jgi:LacI family transcriptional regulator
MAGQAFLDHGHQRIAYFGRYRYRLTQAHEQGLRQNLLDHGLDLPETCVHYGTSLEANPNETRSRINALETMFDGSEPITAILCNDDNEAELINYLVTEMGLKVPEDVSLIGFGDCHERPGVFLSRLTSVAVNEFDLGARAAAVLHEMATGQRPADSDEIIYKPLTLAEGKTLGAVPKQHVQPGA